MDGFAAMAIAGKVGLDDTQDPKALIPGDTGALQTTIGHLRTFASAFGETAQGMAGLDTSHWQGQAADAFRAKYAQHPQQWSDAQHACASAATALESYSRTLSWAQGQAQQAIDLYAKAQQATRQAEDAYQQQTDAYNSAVLAYTVARNNGETATPPAVPAAFFDPGAATKQQAQTILDRARAQRDTAGQQAQRAIAAGTNLAPQEPSFWSRMGDDLSDFAGGLGIGAVHVAGGAIKGAAGVVDFARSLNPTDPYNATHPAEYVDTLSSTAAGLVHTTLHPVDAVKSLIGAGWGSDPAEAFGKLLPNALLAAGTDGAGTAAEAGEAVAERALIDTGEDTATTAGRALAKGGTDQTSTAVEQAGGPGSPSPMDSGADWGDFGPRGSDPTDRNLAGADVAASTGIANAGAGLGNVQRDLDSIHINTETSPSSAGPADTAPVTHLHAPPTVHAPTAGGTAAMPDAGGGMSDLQRRLEGFGAQVGQAAHDIADAGAGLVQFDRDLQQVHVVREPEGPEHNNPDYNDRRYEAGPGARKAYDQQYPRNEADRRWLKDVRQAHPERADRLTDQELLALRRMTWRDHADVNLALRTGDQAALARLDPVIRNAASALNKLPDYLGGPVRRGIDIAPRDLAGFLKRYREGGQVTEWAFTSTDKAVPHSGNVQYVINGGHGKDISWLQDPSVGQQEVVHAPGSTFKNVDRVFFDEEEKQWNIFLRG